MHCALKAGFLPTVLLPGNGEMITDTAVNLALAYRNADDAESRLYNRSGIVFSVDRDRNNAIKLTALSVRRACSEFERVAHIGKMKKEKDGESNDVNVEPTVFSSTVAKTIYGISLFS